MPHWILLAAPLLIAAVALALAFAGCEFEIPGVDVIPVPYSDVVINTPGLVSYWRLNDAPPAALAADSKDGNIGTYKGNVMLGVPGLVYPFADKAAQFDGASGYVSVPYQDASLNPPKLTVEASVTVVGGDNTLRAIVSSRDISAGNGFGYSLYVSAENRWEAWIGDGTSGGEMVQVGRVDAVKVGAGPPNGPHYVAMTYDGATLALYVDPVDLADKDQAMIRPMPLKPNTKT